MQRLRLRSLVAVTAAALAAAATTLAARAAAPAGGGDAPSLAAVGKRLFFDGALSEPRGTSCASCHDPRRAFSGANGSTIGVPRGSRPGRFARRNAPSLLYLKYVPRFHYFQEEDSPVPGAFGGFFWDGRADSIAALVAEPLFNPDEMNNRDPAQLAAKLRASGYFPDLARPEEVLAALGRALEAYLTSAEMAPFSSKYDAYVRGRAVFTAEEERGLALFRSPDKGNCAACHKLTVSSASPERSMFTDYGYDVVAAPRNRKLPGTRRAAAGNVPYDLGLCERKERGPTRSDDAMWCSSFRTPSLRNVAVRPAFMHNGAFADLRDVVAFYATRATDPRRWYRRGPVFDDVPPRLRGQVNVNSIPYNRRPGAAPALDDGEIDAIVTFLRTLTEADLL